MSARAVFLDRDGVVNDVVERDGKPASPRSLEEFRISAGVAEAVRSLRAAGLLVFVVTNQPDIARGLMSQSVLDAQLARVRREVGVDAVAVCPHDDADGCDCRKPKAGLLVSLAREWRLDLQDCYFIGDTWRDVAAGQAAGCRTVLLDRHYNQQLQPDVRVGTIGEAAAMILGNEAGAAVAAKEV